MQFLVFISSRGLYMRRRTAVIDIEIFSYIQKGVGHTCGKNYIIGYNIILITSGLYFEEELLL